MMCTSQSVCAFAEETGRERCEGPEQREKLGQRRHIEEMVKMLAEHGVQNVARMSGENA